MPDQRRLDSEQQTQSPRFSMGAQTLFILINGLILTFVAYFAISYMTSEMRMTDARNATRDIFHEASRQANNLKETISALGKHFSSLSEPYAITGYQAQKISYVQSGDIPVDLVIWGPMRGSWHYLDFRIKKETLTPDGPIKGWPGYADLDSIAADLEEQDILYLTRIPGDVFTANVVANPAKAPVGFLARGRAADGRDGFILSVTTPEKLFGGVVQDERLDIRLISFEDRESGNVFYRAVFNQSAGNYATEKVSQVIQLADRYLTMRIEVVQTPIARVLGVAPFLGAFIVFLITLVAAAISERKIRQDKQMAEMSESLVGAQHEIKSKISERDNLYYALRQSEREYRAMIDSVSEIIFETDQSGKIVFLNEAWKRVMGMDVEATLGKSLFLMMDPEDQLHQKEMFEELVRGERQAYRTETRMNVIGKAFKPVEVGFSMLRMAEDKSLRAVGTITDIEKRKKSEQAIRDAEQRFRAIFENSVSGIYQVSSSGKVIRANTALAELLGYQSPEEMIMAVSNIGQQLYVRPEERKGFEQKLLFEGRVTGVESELYRKDGRRLWVMENARAVRNEKGNVEYFEGSLWDISARKESDEAMRQARLQAEISSRSRMEFLANMSHELRTPLNAVIGFAEIIKDEIMGPLNVPVYKEYARDIYDSGNSLLKIISEILEVSKIETGNRELNVSNFKLGKALKSCLVIMQNRIDESGVAVRLDIPEKLPDILGEELGFKQVIMNLISNAIKFTDKGGNVRVTARILDEGEMVIEVIDNGIGMTAEEIKKAMQPFGKVDNAFSSMKSGTGLGLTIVESLVRLHGGHFELVSEKGTGTTARIILPAFRILSMQEEKTA